MQLNKKIVVNEHCVKVQTWFNLWLNIWELVKYFYSPACFVDNARLIYDNLTRTTSSPEGVETRIPGFGDPTVVELIDPSGFQDFIVSSTKYFKYIGDHLVDNGWVRNKSLRGAPYDFRKGPNENTKWFVDMKKLVEDTYAMNENTPVSIICHSMGCPMSLLLLQNQTQEWKDKYISKYITLAGAFGGSVKALKVFAAGDNLDSTLIDATTMRGMMMTMPSTALLLPSPHFWDQNDVLVKTPERTYTLSQLQDFFNDLGFPTGYEMAKDQAPYIDRLVKPPNVETHCFYGTNVPTIETMRYRTTNIQSEYPILTYGDGDGTVNHRSLSSCAKWFDQQQKLVSVIEIPNADHMSILNHANVMEYILIILNS